MQVFSLEKEYNPACGISMVLSMSKKYASSQQQTGYVPNNVSELKSSFRFVLTLQLLFLIMVTVLLPVFTGFAGAV